MWCSKAWAGVSVAVAAFAVGAYGMAVSNAATEAGSGAATASAGVAAWRITDRVHSGATGDFTAVAALGSNGGWAFNGISTPTAWERNGSSWKQVPFPTHGITGPVIAAAALSPSDAWAFTQGTVTQSRVYHWNGSAWSVVRTFQRQIGGAVVLSADDVWVFGEPFIPGAYLGAWHYDGHTWTAVKTGGELEGGSGLSADDVWAFDGTDVAHWNGHTWSRTSVASLLPPKQELNGPMLTGIYAQSRDSVYAIGNGNEQDEGGPTVVLHWNGHTWSRVAEASYGFGTSPLQQIVSDGSGGLWLPMPGAEAQRSYLLHFTNGRLTPAALPVASSKITVDTVALIPGTTSLLGGGYTHAANSPGNNVVSVLLQYGS